MDVNYEVWGQPETWIPAGSEEGAKADLKMGASGQRQNYNQLWYYGYLNYDTIDQPFYWGMPKNALFAKRYYLAPYESDGETQVASFPIADIDEPTIPVNFYTNARIPYTYLRYSDRYAPLGAMPAQSFYNENVVCLSFNYQKILAIPYVAYVSDDYTSGASVSPLYDYIENALYNTKNRIISIGYKVALGDGDTNRTTTVRMAAFMNYEKIKHYDVTYNGVPFAFRTDAKYVLCTVDDFSSGAEAVRAAYFAPLYRQSETVNYTVGDSQTALAYRYCKSDPTTSIPFYCYDPDSELWKVNGSYTANGVKYWYAYPYIEVTAENAETVRDYILTQIAYLGLPFVYDPSLASRGQIGDIGVYLPKFDENGVTTGEYAEGTAALTLPNAEWVDGRTGAGYDPTRPPTPPGEDDIGDLENSTVGTYGYTGGNKLYLLTQAEVDTFMNTINAYYTPSSGDTPEDIQDKKDRLQLDFKGSNPFNYIVGLYALPLYVGYQDGSSNINLGPVDTGITARLATPGVSKHFDFGTWEITPQFNDFRDYAPYTSIELYIPLCGTVQLDPADVMGHTIKVDAIYDLQTGDLTARVLRDKLEGGVSTQWTMIDTVQGSLFVSIPVTADDMGNFQNRQHFIKASMISKAVNFLGGTADTVYSDASSVAGAVAGTGGSPHLTSPFRFLTSGFNAGMGIGLGRYQLTHSPLTPFQVSTASSAIGFNMYPRAKIFIKRPKMLPGYHQPTYAHTVGNATCENTTVGTTIGNNNRTGLIVCSDVDLSGLQTGTDESATRYPATLEEQRLIKQALTSGVYV